MNPLNPMKNKFWLGYFAAVCVTSLVQDALGPEGVAARWLDARITVPLALTGLLAVLVLLRRSVR